MEPPDLLFPEFHGAICAAHGPLNITTEPAVPCINDGDASVAPLHYLPKRRTDHSANEISCTRAFSGRGADFEALGKRKPVKGIHGMK